eukprot:m.314576 g.314576  ORF g.314576 m.314576 type:complete len:70 (-) comp19669_c0_seq6:378-587(-)
MPCEATDVLKTRVGRCACVGGCTSGPVYVCVQVQVRARKALFFAFFGEKGSRADFAWLCFLGHTTAAAA